MLFSKTYTQTIRLISPILPILNWLVLFLPTTILQRIRFINNYLYINDHSSTFYCVRDSKVTLLSKILWKNKRVQIWDIISSLRQSYFHSNLHSAYNFWLFSLLKMNVRDDDYSRNATCALIYISTLLY
jgi:hypothetical protein